MEIAESIWSVKNNYRQEFHVCPFTITKDDKVYDWGFELSVKNNGPSDSPEDDMNMYQDYMTTGIEKLLNYDGSLIKSWVSMCADSGNTCIFGSNGIWFCSEVDELSFIHQFDVEKDDLFDMLRKMNVWIKENINV